MRFLWYISSGCLAGLYWYWSLMEKSNTHAASSEIFISTIPAGVLASFVLFSGFIWVGKMGLDQYSQASDEPIDEITSFSFFIAPLIYVVIGLATIGMSINIHEADRGLLASLFLGFIFMIANLIDMVYGLLGSFPLAFCTLVILPYFLMGIYSMVVSSPTLEVAKKHVEVKRPTDIVEKELSAAVMSGLKTDLQLRKLIHELPPFQRFFHTLTYKLKAEKYRKIRDLARAQTAYNNARTDLGDAAIDLELSRRASQKRCAICSGSGKLTTDKKTVTCSMCDGSGYL